MLNKVKSIRDLPYKLFVGVLIPNETDLDSIDDIDAYLIVTKSPKMTMLFFEYEEGSYNRVSKEVWNKVKYIGKLDKNDKKSGEVDGKSGKI